LIRFLFNNKDVFAWSANNLCGVNRDVIEHSLNVDPSFRPRKQRLRKMFDDKAEGARNEVKMSDDKAKGARNEVKRLLSAGVIREVNNMPNPIDFSISITYFVITSCFKLCHNFLFFVALETPKIFGVLRHWLVV
jgi:hypothetical protein